MNHRLLILAYSFPPDVAVGGQRPARFCRYLPEYGVEPIVLSVAEQYYDGLDSGFRVNDDLRVERTAQLRNPLSFYGAIKAKLHFRNTTVHPRGDPTTPTPTPTPTPTQEAVRFRDHAIACFQLPDAYWGWYRPAVRRAREIVRSERISAVLSTSPPVTAHLVARSLKLKFGIPWIADFRDPWRDTRAKPSPSWYMKISERLKRQCIESADRVLCNTDRLRLRMMSEFPALPEEQFVTLTNGFDDIDMGGFVSEPTPSETLSFMHIGSLYGDRRIGGLACALKRLRDRQLLNQQIKFVFLGAEDAVGRKQVIDSAPELLDNGTIEFRERVPRNQVPGIMASARVLVLVQGDYELQVPAKFYEYLRTGLPMLAITKPGALSDIVNATGSGIWADPDDVEAIAIAVQRVVNMPSKSPAEVSSKFGKYHYRELTGRLAEIVHEVTSVSPPKGNSACAGGVPENECVPTAREPDELEKR